MVVMVVWWSAALQCSSVRLGPSFFFFSSSSSLLLLLFFFFSSSFSLLLLLLLRLYIRLLLPLLYLLLLLLLHHHHHLLLHHHHLPSFPSPSPCLGLLVLSKTPYPVTRRRRWAPKQALPAASRKPRSPTNRKSHLSVRNHLL